MNVELQEMERDIARCRVVLSMALLLVVYIDPEEPLLARWFPFVTGPFTMDPRLFLVMATHLVYSIVLYRSGGSAFSPRTAVLTTWIDVFFAAVVAAMTTGVTGPSYPFFAFAVASSGLRGGLRQAVVVTTVSLVVYLVLLFLSSHRAADVFIMRPVYLAITGYLIGYLGQQRLELQAQMRQLEVAEQRHRIARDLHDNYAQALAGITLRLEGARRLLRDRAVDRALDDLTELQDSVRREFDDLRRYARSLAGVEPSPSADASLQRTQLSMQVDVSAPAELVEHVMGIVREGISNLRRHAGATSARIDIHNQANDVLIDIRDNGVGFRDDVTPWSIASRVKEIGGRLEILANQDSGARLTIIVPQG